MTNNIILKSNLFLKSIFIFYYFNSIHSSSCPVNKPFPVADKTCADFTEICIKTDNQECNTLQNACKQCPPSNFTALMLLDIMNIVKAQSNFTNEVNRLTVRFNSTEAIFQSKIKKLTDQMTAELIIVVLFLIIFLPFLILLTVSIRRIRKLHRMSPSILEMVPFVNPIVDENNILISGLARNCDTRFENIDLRMQQIFELCDRLESTVTDVSLRLNRVIGLDKNAKTNIENIDSGMQRNIHILEFHIVGLDKPIKLDVQGNDNIVKIKHQLYSKLVNKKPYDYKRMRIMVNGKYIDDNNYLLPLIKSPMDEIRCEVDGSIKDSDIIILQLQGNRCLPELIQIDRSQKVNDLKEIILNYKQCETVAIYKDSTELVDNLIVADCPLADYDWIKVIAIERGKLTISSIFDEGPSQDVEYSNSNKISCIKNILAQKLGFNIDDLNLAYGSSYCEDDTFLFEMNLASDSNIQYLISLKLDGVILADSLYLGESSELFQAIEKCTKNELVMKRYELPSIRKLKDNKLILNDLIKLQITKTHSRFAKTLGMYHDDKYFYIAMEKLKGSLQETLGRDSAFSKRNIPPWANQILEGLSFLHEHNIVHGDIKPSNILLTEQNNIKLSVLGLSKYRHSQKISHLKKGLTLAKIGTTMYMAPEVYNNVTIELKADIYSFGVTLTELFSGVPLSVKEPRKNEKLLSILNKLNVTDEIKNIINECWIEDYQSRPSAKALLDKMPLKC